MLVSGAAAVSRLTTSAARSEDGPVSGMTMSSKGAAAATAAGLVARLKTPSVGAGAARTEAGEA